MCVTRGANAVRQNTPLLCASSVYLKNVNELANCCVICYYFTIIVKEIKYYE